MTAVDAGAGVWPGPAAVPTAGAGISPGPVTVPIAGAGISPGPVTVPSAGAGAGIPPECGASAIVTKGGPTAVPMRLCCAVAIIRAAGADPGSLMCGNVDVIEFGHPPVPILIAEPAP